MTLCTAWIRETSDNEELYFATDSTLTGGERWDHGVKLFELPRKDCLICFAGSVGRAYPLILNLISLLKNDLQLCVTETDIGSLVHNISTLFTELVRSISDYPENDEEVIGSEAKFLFGGWSWQEEKFKVWNLNYSNKSQMFLPEEKTNPENSKFCTFTGDPNSIESKAKKLYKKLLDDRDKIDGKLEMEPLEILIRIINDDQYREVGGSPQIARIKKNGQSEILGIQWRGDPYVLGKRYFSYNKPSIHYIDENNFSIIDECIIPSFLDEEIILLLDEHEKELIKKIYDPKDKSSNKMSMTSHEIRKQVSRILKERVYEQFISTCSNMAIEVEAEDESLTKTSTDNISEE
jgi:hypothetical protein